MCLQCLKLITVIICNIQICMSDAYIYLISVGEECEEAKGIQEEYVKFGLQSTSKE